MEGHFNLARVNLHPRGNSSGLGLREAATLPGSLASSLLGWQRSEKVNGGGPGRWQRFQAFFAPSWSSSLPQTHLNSRSNSTVAFDVRA